LIEPEETNQISPRRTLRLLLVEDMPADAELAVATLKRAGYALSFEVVDSPELFRQHLEQGEYDLVLADHNLRTWTGMDALEILQRCNKDVPLVVVTATLGDEAAVDYIKRGAADYVLKHRLDRLPLAVSRTLRDKAFREEKARLQDQILCAKREWELTFDTVPDPVLVLDKECRIQRANRPAAELLGIGFRQMIGRKCYEILHALDEPPADCPHQHLLQTGQEARGDIEEPRLGKVFHVTCTPLRDTGGALRGSVHVMRDITERKQADEALRQSEARYRSLFENATYGIFQVGLDGSFVDANPALVRMLGYGSKEELLTRNLATDIFDDPEASVSLLAGHQTKAYQQGIEVAWKRKDGTPITVRATGRAVHDQQEQLAHIEVIAHDVTERRMLEKQNRQLQKFEAIGRLAGGIAHDFNNVIGAVLGWAQIGFAEAPEGSRLRSHFKKIRDQAVGAAGLTRQLLAFARRQILEPRNINLNQTIAEVVSLLEKILGAQIEVKTVQARDLMPAFADATQVEQVLMNLCLNARDAMPQGGSLLIETQNAQVDEEYCRLRAYARPGRYVLLSVSDTGVGMDAATLERIFEPFFTTKEAGSGTGLGLAMVYGIVKQHGGFVQVYSEPGHGTTFRVYFPAGAGVAEEQKKSEPDQVQGGAETILVVEDHEGMRTMAQEALSGLGYDVLLASDGEEAVRMFEAECDRVALVVLDVVMPKLNGPKAYVQMSARKPGLPAIFTTGYSAEMGMLSSMLERGAVILQKPYNPASLGRKVREVLDASSRQPLPK